MQNDLAIKPCPWDPERLALIATTPQEEHAIIGLLLSQGERTVNILHSLTDASGQSEWRRASHSLAGSAANLGMIMLEKQCRKAESLTLPASDRIAYIEAIEQALQDIALYQPSSER